METTDVHPRDARCVAYARRFIAASLLATAVFVFVALFVKPPAGWPTGDVAQAQHSAS